MQAFASSCHVHLHVLWNCTKLSMFCCVLQLQGSQQREVAPAHWQHKGVGSAQYVLKMLWLDALPFCPSLHEDICVRTFAATQLSADVSSSTAGKMLETTCACGSMLRIMWHGSQGVNNLLVARVNNCACSQALAA